MSLRIDRILAGTTLLGALVFACTSPVNDDVVLRGRSEPPAFGGMDGGDGSAGPRNVEGGEGLCPSNECPDGRVTCPNKPFPCGVDLMSDDENCGACGVRCPQDDDFLLRFYGIAQCVNGACKMRCAADCADCNGLLDDGCEVPWLSQNNDNCGGCGIKCNAPEVCNSGVCTCKGPTCPCPPGKTRCEDLYCHDLTKEDENCGACGNICPPSTEPPFPAEWNMIRKCGNSKCNQPSCNEGWADCNGDFGIATGNGCETHVFTDTNNCGTCGYACQAGEVCIKGKCECRCGDACFTGINSDLDNCGSCAFECPGARGGFMWSGINAAHGNPTCVQGACGYECLEHWSDCDDDIRNGCEVDLFSDPLNCGGCGVRCDGIEGQACIDGRCLMKECTVQ